MELKIPWRLARSGSFAPEFFRPLFRTRFRKFALSIVALYVILAIIGPVIVDPPFELQRTASGSIANAESPSLHHPLGTTTEGYSVLRLTIHSFRTSVFVGAGAAFLVTVIGLNVGLVAGYYGGRVDTALMGITDIVYGLPLYPFAIIFVLIAGRSTLSIVLVIGIVLWRSIARITRSETLTLKEREFVKNARAVGTTPTRIMYKHILPNLIPLVMVYFIFGTTWGVIVEASLSFLGLGNPDTPSWGLMLHEAFSQVAFTTAPWWILPPSVSLWLFIGSLYVVARALEENVETGQNISR